MSGRSDLEALVEQARSGSPAAWGKVYEASSPAIYRLCRRLLSTREDAEDATAEIFLKARLHLAQYDGGRPFAPWLFRVAANHCWDELKKRRREGYPDDPEPALERLEDEGPSPQETVLASENRDRIRDALAALDDRSRMVVGLRYFAELPYSDIADALGISTNLVGVLLLRARRQLRRHLSA